MLQSGSFFRQRYDKQESGFARYRRITRFVGTVLRGVEVEQPIPVAITCGTGEENRANNEALAIALTAQGYAAWAGEVRDGHTWTAWRDSLDPHLPALIEAVL
jgi:enterochelin esterase family protein